MRILFTVDQGYLPQRTGGALESTHALCKAFIEHGHDVAVLADLMPNGFVGVTNRLKRRLGWSLPRDNVVGYPVYRDWNPTNKVALLCQKFRPDIAIVKSGEDPSVAESLSNQGVPTIIYLRDIEFDRDNWRIPKGENISFIANTTFAADRFERRFGIGRPAVIHSLIRPDQYRVNSTRNIITFINPTSAKGLEIALDLARQRSDIPFCFIESWPLTVPQFKNLERNLGKLQNVSLRRWMSDIRQIYAQTRILLVPSQLVEAQARSVAEVQVSGIPVIASDIGGLPESVGPGGILVGPKNVEGWRRALDQLWDDPSTYEDLSRQALRHSTRLQLRPEYITATLLKLIESKVK